MVLLEAAVSDEENHCCRCFLTLMPPGHVFILRGPYWGWHEDRVVLGTESSVLCPFHSIPSLIIALPLLPVLNPFLILKPRLNSVRCQGQIEITCQHHWELELMPLTQTPIDSHIKNVTSPACRFPWVSAVDIVPWKYGVIIRTLFFYQQKGKWSCDSFLHLFLPLSGPQVQGNR